MHIRKQSLKSSQMRFNQKACPSQLDKHLPVLVMSIMLQLFCTSVWTFRKTTGPTADVWRSQTSEDHRRLKITDVWRSQTSEDPHKQMLIGSCLLLMCSYYLCKDVPIARKNVYKTTLNCKCYFCFKSKGYSNFGLVGFQGWVLLTLW